MTDDILELCRLLAGERVAIADLAALLGAIAEDRGAAGPITLTPRSPHLAAIRILREDAHDEPYLVLLDLAPSAPLTVADLARVFGAPNERRRLQVFDEPRLMFTYDDWERPRFCTLVATAADRRGELAASRVVKLSLRSDQRPLI